MRNPVLDMDQVRKSIEILFGFKDNPLIEVRTLGKARYSGYFHDRNNLLRSIKSLPEETHYVVMNSIKEDCYHREQRECMTRSPKSTTSDSDISQRDWVLIDADPKRITGISASDSEKEHARDTINRIYRYLKETGFEEPVVADSGNGYHLLYRIQADNKDSVTEMISQFLKALDIMFSDEHVGVDRSVFNASRIIKLYGTVSKKGADTPDRPYRMSRILSVPPEIKVTNGRLFAEVAAVIPKSEAKASYSKGYAGGDFKLEDFISRHGIRVDKIRDFQGGKKYVLECCPFNSEHKSPDSAIFEMADGALSFKCFHNSCSDYKWQDLRMLFEPEAYNRKFVKPSSLPNHANTDYKPVKIEGGRAETGEPVFYCTEQIRNMKTEPAEYIRTGIDGIDRKIRGLRKKFVSVITGLRASGKSSVVSQLILEAVDQQYKVALFSGELTASHALDWLLLQGAGPDNVTATQYENFYEVRSEAREAVSKWLDNMVYIYNNNYGNKFENLIHHLNDCVISKKVDLIILDNLMSLDVSSLGFDRNQQQSSFVQILCDFAKANNIHVIFVAHPRKANGFLRLDDVAGSGDIGNRVDNAFIVHRVNNDFRRLSGEMFKWHADDEIYAADNVIEITKDRASGVQDHFVPLYFDRTCKRLRNSLIEKKVYAWDSRYVEISDDISPFET